MLKELNRIAAGLLGLHGYPAQPWTSPAPHAASRREATPGVGRRAGATRKAKARAAHAGAATPACR